MCDNNTGIFICFYCKEPFRDQNQYGWDSDCARCAICKLFSKPAIRIEEFKFIPFTEEEFDATQEEFHGKEYWEKITKKETEGE